MNMVAPKNMYAWFSHCSIEFHICKYPSIAFSLSSKIVHPNENFSPISGFILQESDYIA